MCHGGGTGEGASPDPLPTGHHALCHRRFTTGDTAQGFPICLRKGEPSGRGPHGGGSKRSPCGARTPAALPTATSEASHFDLFGGWPLKLKGPPAALALSGPGRPGPSQLHARVHFYTHSGLCRHSLSASRQAVTRLPARLSSPSVPGRVSANPSCRAKEAPLPGEGGGCGLTPSSDLGRPGERREGLNTVPPLSCQLPKCPQPFVKQVSAVLSL